MLVCGVELRDAPAMSSPVGDKVEVVGVKRCRVDGRSLDGGDDDVMREGGAKRMRVEVEEPEEPS
jgi:hypothetical protein